MYVGNRSRSSRLPIIAIAVDTILVAFPLVADTRLSTGNVPGVFGDVDDVSPEWAVRVGMAPEDSGDRMSYPRFDGHLNQEPEAFQIVPPNQCRAGTVGMSPTVSRK